MIETTGIEKRYGRTVALQGLSLTMSEGVTGILGPNGAGKTTFLRILATVMAPDNGTVRLLGMDPTQVDDRVAIRRRLGYFPQEPGLYPSFTAFEFVDYVAILKEMTDRRARQDEVRRVLGLVGLTDVAGKKIKTLSGGMKRRVVLAQALLGDPDVLVLDEPTSGLDPEQRLRFRELLSDASGHAAVVLSTHQTVDVAAVCSRVALARLVGGGPDDAVGLVGHGAGRRRLHLDPARGGDDRESNAQGDEDRPRPSVASDGERGAEHHQGGEVRDVPAHRSDGERGVELLRQEVEPLPPLTLVAEVRLQHDEGDDGHRAERGMGDPPGDEYAGDDAAGDEEQHHDDQRRRWPPDRVGPGPPKHEHAGEHHGAERDARRRRQRMGEGASRRRHGEGCEQLVGPGPARSQAAEVGGDQQAEGDEDDPERELVGRVGEYVGTAGVGPHGEPGKGGEGQADSCRRVAQQQSRLAAREGGDRAPRRRRGRLDLRCRCREHRHAASLIPVSPTSRR
jgi:ABC-2 type transport system ATP-binding protein